MSVHKSVLLRESVGGLNLKKGDVAVDATLGGGGHSLEMLKIINPGGRLIAIDRDENAIENFKKKLASLKFEPEKENIKLVRGNFSDIDYILRNLGFQKVNAILADLGISSDQLAEEGRGMSFQKDEFLDMRMDRSGGITAMEVVNSYSRQDLEKILKEYGGERHFRGIAKSIIKERKNNSIKTTRELVNIIETSVPQKYKRQKIHFATKTFQAIRIEVNGEMENIRNFIPKAIASLQKGGRLAVISFHGGEDAIVKSLFRENARGCICPKEIPICVCGKKPSIRIITKKPIVPGEEEVKNNPRARSAKLRIAERL